MTAKSKIFRYFSQCGCDAMPNQILLDEFEDPALIGGEDIAHTYKCTYFWCGVKCRKKKHAAAIRCDTSVPLRFCPVEIGIAVRTATGFLDLQIEGIGRLAGVLA